MNNRSVLILSDKDESILTWMDAFRQRGLDAASTASTSFALNCWETDPPMLTVVDLSLSVGDCLQVCRTLRAIDVAPILLILPAARGEEILDAFHAGVTECLIQPNSPAVILLKALAWSMRAGWDWPSGTSEMVQ